MSQNRITSIHRLLMRLFPAFCLGKALNGNVKHFVFDLTFDVTGDLEVKFLNFIWKNSSRPFHCRLNFSPTSVGFRDRWGGATAPPPQQRVGSGLGPAGRGLSWQARQAKKQFVCRNCRTKPFNTNEHPKMEWKWLLWHYINPADSSADFGGINLECSLTWKFSHLILSIGSQKL